MTIVRVSTTCAFLPNDTYMYLLLLLFLLVQAQMPLPMAAMEPVEKKIDLASVVVSSGDPGCCPIPKVTSTRTVWETSTGVCDLSTTFTVHATSVFRTTSIIITTQTFSSTVTFTVTRYSLIKVSSTELIQATLTTTSVRNILIL